jgi:hypothetical protein
MAGPDLDVGLSVVGGSGAHPLLDLARHCQESLLNIAGILGRRLEEGNSQAISEFLHPAMLATNSGTRQRLGKCDSYLCDGVLNHLLIGHIALIADKQLVHAFGGVPVDLLEPLLDVVERIHVRHIIDNADAVCTSVVG